LKLLLVFGLETEIGVSVCTVIDRSSVINVFETLEPPGLELEMEELDFRQYG